MSRERKRQNEKRRLEHLLQDTTQSGDYEASDLESRTTTVRVEGTNKAKLLVIESLDVVIIGAGEVSYFGSPNVTQKITGTGSITSLGDK